MRPLPTRFRSDGFDCFVVKRQGDIALIAKTKTKFSMWSFEVVIIQKREAAINPFTNSMAEAREIMPCDEDWGTYGWTPIDLDAALVKFDELTAKHGFSSTRPVCYASEAHFRVKVKGEPANVPETP